MPSPQSLGGQAAAKVQRAAALTKYFLNPNMCKHCGKIIPIPNGSKVFATRRKKFCNHSCAAAYNNTHRPLRAPAWKACRICGEPSRSPSARLCSKCAPTRINTRTIEDIQSKEGFATNRYARVNQHARYIHVTQATKCQKCGYSKHVEICHIKPITAFDKTTPISIVNARENILLLCPNCHWEFDHNMLDISEIVST